MTQETGKIKQKFKRWWSNVKNSLYSVKYGIINLFYWFKIIWNDRNWDYSYIITLIEHKIKKLIIDYGRYSYHVDKKADIDKMKLTLSLLDKYKNEYYHNELYDYYEFDIYFEPLPDNEELFEMKYKDIKKAFETYFKKYPKTYKNIVNGKIKYHGYDIPEKQDDEDIARQISYHNQDKCNKLLFKILENNLQKWWY